MEYTTEINGIQVNAVYSEETVQQVFMPLLQHLQALRRENSAGFW